MATQNNPFGGVDSWGARADAYKYPNPFCDIASVYLPTNLNDAFEWMEFLMLTMPPFMAVVNRVVSYFLTEIEVNDVSDDVRDNYREVFDDQLHLVQKLQDIGKDYFCFSGDTLVHTSDGLARMDDLARLGKPVDVCGIDGRWHKAVFKSFGVQKTVELEFGNGRKVRTTPSHQWWVDAGDDGDGLSRVRTDGLKYWFKVPVKDVPRPEKDRDYDRGVLHGMALSSGGNPVKAKKCVLDWYSDHIGVEPQDCMLVPPAPEKSRSYWYGVFTGMAETAGYMQPRKHCMFISHPDLSVLERLKEGFESVGLAARSVSRRRIWNGEVRYYMPFSCRHLSEDDFMFEETVEKFRAMMADAPAPRYYTGVRRSPEPPREEEVFCCEEPETHTFTLAGGIVTGNCYGNSFVSLNLPFERYLKCPDCSTEIHISKLKYDFKADTGRFMCECPKCKRGKVEFERIDRRLRDTAKINVIRWNPKRIRLKVHPITGEIKYYYKLEEKFVQRVREGNPFYINTTQWGFIETCCGDKARKNSTECLFEFDEGQIYHMRDTVFAGLQDKIKGWAIPPLLPYFKLAYYIQLMRRYDEAIALDFIMPFRILYPQGQAPGGQDALTMVSMQTFISAMSQMIEKKRANMTAIEVAPFAIGYELIGGEAKQLAPKESIQQAEQELLNAMGFPQELFAGTLSLQAAPVALRLFEREWNPLVDNMNSILQWISDQVARYFMWDKASVRFTPITLADDIEKKGLQMQAAAGQDISKQTAYRAMGIDYLKEQERVIKEQQDVQKMQEKAMAEAQAQQANGAMGGGDGGGAEGGGESGMSGPGGDVGATPGDVFQQAQEIARQLIAANNPAHTRQTLAQVKNTNPTLWAMVKGQLQEQRQQLSSEGRQMLVQQMQQEG